MARRMFNLDVSAFQYDTRYCCNLQIPSLVPSEIVTRVSRPLRRSVRIDLLARLCQGAPQATRELTGNQDPALTRRPECIIAEMLDNMSPAEIPRWVLDES